MTKKIKTISFGCLSLIYSTLLFAGPPVLKAPEELTPLIEKYLPDLKKIDTDQLDRSKRQTLRRDLQKRVGALLETEGYFSPKIRFSRDDRETDASGPMTLSVDPGPRTVIESIDLEFTGPAPLPETREALLRQAWSLPVGAPFRQADWDRAKNLVLSLLMAEDFAAARISLSQAAIDPETHQARLKIVYATGPKITIGSINVKGLELHEEWLIDRYNRSIHIGDPYNEEAVRDLQTALQSSPYFNQVLVELDLPGDPDLKPTDPGETDDPDAAPLIFPEETAAEQPKTAFDGVEPETLAVPMTIVVRERAPHRIGFGVGVSSNTGLRTEANYHGSRFLGYPWEINSTLRIEQLKQTAFADVFLPPETNGARYSFGVNFEHTSIESLDTQKFAIGGMRTQRIGPFDTNLGVNLQQEKQKPDGAETTTQTALALLSGATWRRIDSLVLPRDGHIVRVELGGGSKAFLSDQDFLRLYGRYQGYFPIGENDVLGLRGEIGATLADSSNGIPQDYVFRAGGTQTVRGYSYQSLGVKNGNAIVGGRYMSVASAEYTHWLPAPSSWGIAAFVDAGNASDNWTSPVIGAGLGARYKTPAGPVAVDLAYGFNDDAQGNRGGLNLHFTLAIPF